MRIFFSILAILLLLSGGVLIWAAQELKPRRTVFFVPPKRSLWNFQSIDTMKYSRDLARERLDDTAFDSVIERQVSLIAQTGVTHIAIATPYDPEFLPFLKRWVAAARQHHLRVWFRGNWSGWEGWFDYPAISRADHLARTRAFILAHPELFEDGDAFSSCPECENGGPGDPRLTSDVAGYRAFLIDEYRVTQDAFAKIGKQVRSNLFSMNGDVAKLIMDRATTQALGGVVTVDHYVKTPERLVQDLESLARTSGGRVILGEFGAPIPDIHGDFSDKEQAAWITKTMSLLERSTVVEGMNYWLSFGGSTAIWQPDGKPKEGAVVLERYFTPSVLFGFVRDELGRPIQGARVRLDENFTTTDKDGQYTLYYHKSIPGVVTVEAVGYIDHTEKIAHTFEEHTITLSPTQKDWKFKLLEFIVKHTL